LHGLTPGQIQALGASLSRRAVKDAKSQVAEGVCFLRLSQYAFARQALEEALRADGRCADAYAQLAWALLAGRHPRTLGLPAAREIVRHANAALAIDARHAHATAILALVVREYFENGSVRHDGPGADELCKRLEPLLTQAMREALKPHVRTSDKQLTKILLP